MLITEKDGYFNNANRKSTRTSHMENKVINLRFKETGVYSHFELDLKPFFRTKKTIIRMKLIRNNVLCLSIETFVEINLI